MKALSSRYITTSLRPPALMVKPRGSEARRGGDVPDVCEPDRFSQVGVGRNSSEGSQVRHGARLAEEVLAGQVTGADVLLNLPIRIAGVYHGDVRCRRNRGHLVHVTGLDHLTVMERSIREGRIGERQSCGDQHQRDEGESHGVEMVVRGRSLDLSGVEVYRWRGTGKTPNLTQTPSQ